MEENQLWIQEKVREGKICLVIVAGTENLADALTKYVDSDILEKHIAGTECEIVGGRHEQMPEANLEQKAAEGDQEDQEEDQLGMLGSMEHADNHDSPRETIEDNCANSKENYNNTAKQNLVPIKDRRKISLSNVSTICPMEARSIVLLVLLVPLATNKGIFMIPLLTIRRCLHW